MKTVSLLILLPCLLILVHSIKIPYVSDIKGIIANVSKLDFSEIPTGFTLPKISQFKSPASFPSLNEIMNMTSQIPSSVVEKVNGELHNFLNQQIHMFENVSLMIYNDSEKPINFKLNLPDFNVLNLFSDLNDKVTIKLYTKETGKNFEILGVNNKTALEESHFDTKRDTFIITHGFMASSDGLSCTLVRDALLNTSNANVITVNWSPLSTGDYVTARLFVPRIGAHIGQFVNFLYENGLNPNKITLIGHSLGAQTMGFVGQTSNQKVKRIIGLDPAWPLFYSLPDNQRLSKDDAQYVEVIHTNAGLLGIPSSTGHYDFYPNGGFFQAGCLKEFFSACSHGRSYKFLSEEIANEAPDFYGIKCNSSSVFKNRKCASNDKAIMGGFNFQKEKQGDYYLRTKDEEPFSLGMEGLIP